jgi:prepilin-type N-terminal cleavage/methylation domain-containing protein
MNMILKKQMADRGIHGGTLKLPSFGGVPRSGGVVIRRRNGFTLVEVIVVLVILAILAAIAIPALTGYIDKANDKKYIADARNAAVAVRTVIDELYAEGTLGKGITKANLQTTFSLDDTGYAAFWFRDDYLTAGDHGYDITQVKSFNPERVSQMDNGASALNTEGSLAYFRDAAELMGTPYPPAKTSPGAWVIHLFSDRSSSHTILDAPAFVYTYFIQGEGEDNIVVVTYGLDGFDPDTAVRDETYTTFMTKGWTEDGYFQYDQNAGYKVLEFEKYV